LIIAFIALQPRNTSINQLLAIRLEPETLDDLHELQSLMGGSMMQTKRQNSAGNISNSASEVGVRVLGAGRLTVDNLPYHHLELRSIITTSINN
jgi:hypothetical protein